MTITVDAGNGQVIEFPDVETAQRFFQENGAPTPGAANQSENALQVLEGLESRGDLRPSEVQELERLRAASGQNQGVLGQTEASYRGALQGASFLQADEIYGLLGGNKEAARAANAASEAQYPEQYNRAKTGGAAMTGLGLGVATAPMAAGASLLGTAARSAGLGFGEGFAWGSGGAAEGDKVKQGLRSGLVNAGIGAALPYAVAGGGAALRFGDDLARGALNMGNQGRANRSIMSTVNKSGQSVDDIARQVERAGDEGQAAYRTMDALGTPGSRAASGIARAGGPGADEISSFLAQRQADQGDRIGGFVEDAFQTRGTTAKKTADFLRENRGKTADVLYENARVDAGPVDVRGAVRIIDKRIGGMQGSTIKGDGIDAKLAGFRDRLKAPKPPAGTTSQELSDFDRVLGVKQDIQDARGAAIRAGRNNEARELKKLESSLDRALEDSSDIYRFANDNFREFTRVIDSVERGGQMQARGRFADNVSEIGDMTESQRKAARIGYGDKIHEKIERNAAPTADRSKLLRTEKAEAESSALAVDPELLHRRIAREYDMWRTQNRATGGSMTADNLQDVQDGGAIASAARAGADFATGNNMSLASRVGGGALRIAQGQNEATRKLVSDILMSPDPRKALSAALAGERSGQKRKWVIQSVMRGIARASTD